MYYLCFSSTPIYVYFAGEPSDANEIYLEKEKRKSEKYKKSDQHIQSMGGKQ